MKTETRTQRQKTLKQGFGKKLVLLTFLLMSFTLLKAQSPHGFRITSPANGAIINNRCDLHFCAYDSLGMADGGNPVYITTDNNFNYPDPARYSSYQFDPGMGNNFCFTNENVNGLDLSPGIHTFYLRFSTYAEFEDSVTVTIANPINALCGNLSYSTTALPNGNYNFSVTGLDPNATYTLKLGDPANGYTDSTVFSNVSSANLVHHYMHNGVYAEVFSVIACDGGICQNEEPNIVVTNSCADYTSISYPYFGSPAGGCLNNSVSIQAILASVNLPALSSSSLFINWGDGITDTILIPHNGGIDSAFSVESHFYTTPGVYTAMLIYYDVNACYSDTAIGTINVSGTTCGDLTGVVYDDANNDCSQNIGETGVSGIEVQVTQGSATYIAWTDASGHYAFNDLPTGSYMIQINNLNAGYAITCSNSLAHSTSVAATGSTVENFAVSCSGFDLAVTGISLMDGFYPGQADAILPHVGIVNGSCNQTIACQVKMILDACIQYSTAGYLWFNNPPTTIIPAATGDTLIWDVSDINNVGAFNYWDFATNITTCTSAQVGDSACITMMVLPSAGDSDPSNNTFTRCFEIGVSYDPNNKEVRPSGTGAQGFIPANTPNLTYTVNFQNTGTALAYNIYVLDSIDADLDIKSIEILSASHKMQAYLLPDNTMKFMFANIMLADSTHDKAHSHGYVTYRIEPKTGLTPGTQIKNTGHIYFDYNAAVATNTTLNTIAAPAGINEMKSSGFVKVYPNPAKDKLVVSVSKNGNSTIVITDVLGKTVKQVTTHELQTEINVSDLENGIYFIRLTQNNANDVQKIIINK